MTVGSDLTHTAALHGQRDDANNIKNAPSNPEKYRVEMGSSHSLLPVSVIIPAFNSEMYIRTAIESVLAQTLVPAEIIVVDDGSSDDTRMIVKSFGPTVTLLTNERNSGPGYSRNRGVAQARSPWIAFLDADDLWRPEHLMSMCSLLVQHPQSALSFCPVEVFGLHVGTWPSKIECTGSPFDFFPTQLQGGAIQTSTIVLHRPKFEAVGGFDEIVRFVHGRRVQAEDFDLTLKMAYQYPIIAAPTPTVRYRIHQEQSRTLTVDQNILNFIYRFRFLNALSTSEMQAPRVVEGISRMKTRWVLMLKQYMETNSIPDLRRLIWFGLSSSYIRHETLPFVPRSLVACLCPRGSRAPVLFWL